MGGIRTKIQYGPTNVGQFYALVPDTDVFKHVRSIFTTPNQTGSTTGSSTLPHHHFCSTQFHFGTRLVHGHAKLLQQHQVRFDQGVGQRSIWKSFPSTLGPGGSVVVDPWSLGAAGGHLENPSQLHCDTVQWLCMVCTPRGPYSQLFTVSRHVAHYVIGGRTRVHRHGT